MIDAFTSRRAGFGLMAAAFLVVSACGSDSTASTASSSATGSGADVADGAGASCPTQGDEWEVAMVYIEHNATDADTGVHGVFGGVAWHELCIFEPDGEQIWLVDPLGQLDGLTVSDFLFESREPPADEYSLDDLFADFAEGDYTVAGTDFEGVERVGTAVFTHRIPAEPNIENPALADDPETAADAPVDPTGLVVSWQPVTETIDGGPVTITGYEVIVTQEEHDDPNGLSRPVYDVHVAGDVASLEVADGFLSPDTVYELEVLALEESGNQTISVGFFRTT